MKSRIERKIRKWISLPRNLSSGWISIKKSKSGFHGFTFYHSTGKSEKGFAKLFSCTVVFFLLIMRAGARNRCSYRKFFESFFGFFNQTVKSKSKNRHLSVEIRFLISRSITNPKSEIRIFKCKSKFPNRTHPLCPRTMKRWPFWCTKPFLWEMNIFAI